MPPNAECGIMGRMKPPSVLVMMEPVSLPRLEGIARYAREHHWNLMLDDRLAGGISDWRGDGVIATLRRRSSRLAAVRKLKRAGIPVVDLTIECLRLRLPRVISDHTAIGRLGGEHFKARGFENVVWFSSGWSEVHRRRYQGFSDIFAKKVPRIGLRNLRRRLKECEKPVGVFAYNDTDAAQVIYAARELGLDVPDDVSVLGIGDDPFLCENQSTPISSIRQDLVRGAYEGADLLQRLMDGEAAPAEPVLIPPTGLTARASTDTLAHPDPLVRTALVYIDRHLGESFGAPEIAQALGIARHKLDRLFAEKLEHSVGTEIYSRRIARVKHLLGDPSKPVHAIAEECGFCNVAYLSNVFRKETGFSPRAWRNRICAGPVTPSACE